MKKLLISILICALIISLSACSSKTKIYPDGQETLLADNFIVVKETISKCFGNTCYYIYDKNTKIVYLYTIGGSHATMCPYYIIINDKPELAIYGVNYNIEGDSND